MNVFAHGAKSLILNDDFSEVDSAGNYWAIKTAAICLYLSLFGFEGAAQNPEGFVN